MTVSLNVVEKLLIVSSRMSKVDYRNKGLPNILNIFLLAGLLRPFGTFGPFL